MHGVDLLLMLLKEDANNSFVGIIGDLQGFHCDLLGLPRRPVPRVGTEALPSLGVPVSSATRAERRFAAVAREAASCVSNASTQAIRCSTFATIRRCSARGFVKVTICNSTYLDAGH